jgi:16S rRNA C1402 N4-methylase RsmH
LRPLKRADQVLSHTVDDGITIADCHAAAALIEESNAQTNQLHKTVRKTPVALERAPELHQAKRLFRAVRKEASQALFEVAQLIGLNSSAKARVPLFRREL